MTYVYNCDGFCPRGENRHDSSPAFMGEISEGWFNTSSMGDVLKESGYVPGRTITLCPDCTTTLLLERP